MKQHPARTAAEYTQTRMHTCFYCYPSLHRGELNRIDHIHRRADYRAILRPPRAVGRLMHHSVVGCVAEQNPAARPVHCDAYRLQVVVPDVVLLVRSGVAQTEGRYVAVEEGQCR